MSTSCEIALRWIPHNTLHDKLILVQVMARSLQQAIIWANVDPDLCHHMVSQGHNGIETT